jgi:hypothetical protein
MWTAGRGGEPRHQGPTRSYHREQARQGQTVIPGEVSGFDLHGYWHDSGMASSARLQDLLRQLHTFPRRATVRTMPGIREVRLSPTPSSLVFTTAIALIPKATVLPTGHRRCSFSLHACQSDFLTTVATSGVG